MHLVYLNQWRRNDLHIAGTKTLPYLFPPHPLLTLPSSLSLRFSHALQPSHPMSHSPSLTLSPQPLRKSS